MAIEIAPGVLQVDTLLGGWAEITAGYLVTGTAPILVETGSQTSVPALLAALEDLGVAADELAGIAVTHIHLDHAGGVGDVAAAFPNATIYVHERGARHLVDPTKLVDSAALVYGELLDSLSRLGDLVGVALEERRPHGVRTEGRELEVDDVAQESIGDLEQDARAVPGVRLGTRRAAVVEVA